MSKKQPQFSATVTYTDESKAPGYHAGTLAAVSTWLGRQQSVKDAQFAPAAPVRADEPAGDSK